MMRKFKSRIISFVTALFVAVVVFAGSTPAMATETNNTIKTDFYVEETTEVSEEAYMLRNKIDTLINENSSPRESFKTDYWGYVEVTGEHTGSYHTIYGNQARMCIAFKPLDGNTALSVYVNSGFWAWDLHYKPNVVDSDGYYMYVGPWRDITYMKAYRLFYQLCTTGGNYDPNNERTGAFHVWVDYK